MGGGAIFPSAYCAEGFPHNQVGKESAFNAGDLGSVSGARRSSGEGNCNPLQYPRRENPMGRGAWWAIVHGVARVRHDLATKPPTVQRFCNFQFSCPPLLSHLHPGNKMSSSEGYDQRLQLPLCSNQHSGPSHLPCLPSESWHTPPTNACRLPLPFPSQLFTGNTEAVRTIPFSQD